MSKSKTPGTKKGLKIPEDLSVPLEKRTRSTRMRTHLLLYGAPGFIKAKYDPDFHPQALVDFFRVRFEQITDAERVQTDRGDVKYVTKPVPLATLGEFATTIGVSKQTLWDWSETHVEFRQAKEVALSYQEAHAVKQGLANAANPLVTVLTLKNLQGWSDKAQLDVSGGVKLSFDAQDEET